MNRKNLKAQAREALSDTGREPKIVTLIFLLGVAITIGLRIFLVELVGNMDTGGKYLSDTLTGASKSLVMSYGVAIAFQLLLVLLCAGYTAVALELKNKNPVGVGTLQAGFRMPGKVILTYVLMMLFTSFWAYGFSMPVCYLLIIGVTMGTQVLTEAMVMNILVVYVGIVMFFASYRYRMAFFMLMDNPDLTARQAIRQAGAVNKGHRKQLFLLDLSFVPWILLCILTCGVLLIWKLPYIVTTYAGAYDALMTDYAQRQIRMKEMQEKMFQEERF